MAARVDGHPENAAASVVGGLVAATTVRGAVRAVAHASRPGLVFVAIVPDRPLPTAKARQALPAPGRAGPTPPSTWADWRCSWPGWPTSRLLVQEATEDRLHQDYRSPLFPEAPQLLARLVAGGALASCWSGAGPTLLGICDGADGDRGARRPEAAMEETGVPGQALLLRPDLEGLVVGERRRLPSSTRRPTA